MIVCADDYGLTSDINESILELCSLKKIANVSVLIEKTSALDAKRLNAFRPTIKVGLHLNFEPFDMLNPLASIKRQFEQFKERFGTKPDYVDGHRHCHVYPFVASALARYLATCTLAQGFYVRPVQIHDQLAGVASPLKRVYIMWLNRRNRVLQRLLWANGLSSNRFIWGVLASHTDIESAYQLACKFSQPQDLFFLHPSLKSDGLNRRTDYELAKNI